MARPTPRKSALAGASPLNPPTQVTPSASPDSKQTTVSRKTSASSSRKWRHKVSFYQDPKDTERVRAAILHTMLTEENNRNLSQFINDTVMAEVERLEQKYNDGKPFSGVPAGEMPKGAAAFNH